MLKFHLALSVQYKTGYKKTVYTRNVSVALNLSESLNITEPSLVVNLTRVLHTVQVGDTHVNKYMGLFTLHSNHIIKNKKEKSSE